MTRLLLLCHTVLLFGGGIFYTLAFECPPAARQRFVPDPEDCSKYYQCLSSGKFYHKPCAKGLLFDTKYRMCNWPSVSTCKGSRPDGNVKDSPNSINTKYETKTKKKYSTARPTERAVTTRSTTRRTPRYRSYQKVKKEDKQPKSSQRTTRRYHKATMSTRRTSRATTVKYTRRPKTKHTSVKITKRPTTKRLTKRPNFIETTKRLVRYHTTRPTQKRGWTTYHKLTTKTKSKTPRVSRRWMTSPYKFTKTVRQTTTSENTTPEATSTNFSTKAKLSSATATSTTTRVVPTTTKVIPKFKQLVKEKDRQTHQKSPYLTTRHASTTEPTDSASTTEPTDKPTVIPKFKQPVKEKDRQTHQKSPYLTTRRASTTEPTDKPTGKPTTNRSKTTNSSKPPTTTEPPTENSTGSDEIVTGALWLVLDLPTENDLYKEGSGDTDDVKSNAIIDKKAEMETLKVNPQPLRRDPPLPGLDQLIGIECSSSFALEDDPTRCNGFYQCYMWIPYRKACPAGLKFDTSNKVCNWPSEAPCTDGTKDDDYYDEYEYYDDYYDEDEDESKTTAIPAKKTQAPKRTKGPQNPKTDDDDEYEYYYYEDDDAYYDDNNFPDASKHMSDLGDIPSPIDNGTKVDAGKDSNTTALSLTNTTVTPTAKSANITIKQTVSVNATLSTTIMNTTDVPSSGNTTDVPSSGNTTDVPSSGNTTESFNVTTVLPSNGTLNTTESFNGTTALPSNATLNSSSDVTTDSDIVLDEGIAQGYKSKLLKDIPSKKTTVTDREYDIESSGDDGAEANVLFQNVELYQVATDNDNLQNQTTSKTNDTNGNETTSKLSDSMNATSTNIAQNTTSAPVNATTKIQNTQKPSLITTIIPRNSTTRNIEALNVTTATNADKNASTTTIVKAASTTTIVKAVKLNANISSTTKITKSKPTLSSKGIANATTGNPFNNTTHPSSNSTTTMTSGKTSIPNINTTIGIVSTSVGNVTTDTADKQKNNSVGISLQTTTMTDDVNSSTSPTKPPQQAISATESDVGKDPVKKNAPLMDVITDELGKSRVQKSSNKVVEKKGSNINKLRLKKCNATADICKRRQLLKKKLKQRRKLKKKNGRKQKKLASKRNKAKQNARESSKTKLTKASLIKIVLATKSTNGWDGTTNKIKTNSTTHAPKASSSAPIKTSSKTQTVSDSTSTTSTAKEKFTSNSGVNTKTVHVNVNESIKTTQVSSKAPPTTIGKSALKNKTKASKFSHQISKAIDDTTSLKTYKTNKKPMTSPTMSTTKLHNNINTITNQKISHNHTSYNSITSKHSNESASVSALNITTSKPTNKTVVHSKTNPPATNQTTRHPPTNTLNGSHVSANAVVTKTALLRENSSDASTNENTMTTAITSASKVPTTSNRTTTINAPSNGTVVQTTDDESSKIESNTLPINNTIISSKSTNTNTTTTASVTSSKTATNANGTLVSSVTTIMQKTPSTSHPHPKTSTNQKYDNTIATPSDKIKSKNDVIVLDKAYDSTEIILLPSNFTVPSYDDLLTSKKTPDMKNVVDKKQTSVLKNITSTLSDLINSTNVTKNETTVAKGKNTSPKPQQNMKDRLMKSTMSNVRAKLKDNSNAIVNPNDSQAHSNAVKQDVSSDKMLPRAAAYRNRKFERSEISRQSRGVPDTDEAYHGERHTSSGSDRLGTSIIISLIFGLCLHVTHH